jgi:hypothetical protein
MEQDSVDLSAESLEQAIEKVRIMRDTGVLSAHPQVILGSVSQAATLTNISSGSNRDGGLRVHGRPVEIRPFEVNPDMTMLNDASSPYNVDPETLANLWVVRFGKGWVGNEAVETLEMDTEQVEFWRHAANRLRELGYLEMHTLASSYRVVLRIVE